MRTLAWAIVVAAALTSMAWSGDRIGGFNLLAMPLRGSLGLLPLWSWLIAVGIVVIGLVMMIRCSREEGGGGAAGFEVLRPPGSGRSDSRRP